MFLAIKKNSASPLAIHLNPLDESALLVERHDGVGADVQVARAALRVLHQAPVHEVVELHEAAVLAQVVLGLAHHDVAVPVGAPEGDLLGQLQRLHDLHLVLDAGEEHLRPRERVVQCLLGCLLELTLQT